MNETDWFVTTPYIDAYETPWITNHRCTEEPRAITYDDFVRLMHEQGARWGEHAVGRQVLAGLEPARHGGQFVLAIGWFGKQKLVHVQGTPSLLPLDYPTEWDVT